MLNVAELKLGFSDAENYRRREAKDLLSRIFVRTSALDLLTDSSRYFLIGEKGTGKTAHAVYLSDNQYKNMSSRLRYIRETDYRKFIALKHEKQLVITDYVDIWKVILYLLISEQINERDTKLKNGFSKMLKFRALKNAIDEYYANAFAPEIASAINFVEDAELAASLLAKYVNIGATSSQKVEYAETRFQTNLYFIQRKFEDAFRTLRLKNDYTLFIDGIDIRPGNVPYDEYLGCIKGLANAAWSINNDFFPTIRDSARLRVVLLMRPDIFASVGLQNVNNKLRDNAVVLDWITTYADYRSSALFDLADKLLRTQQKEDLKQGEAWDYYFPYTITPRANVDTLSDNPFIGLLRISFYRPRDIVTALRILQDICIKKRGSDIPHFVRQDLRSREFRKAYSDYLLGEVFDQLLFYHTREEFDLFRTFFTFLNGKRHFTYKEYLEDFTEFMRFIEKNVQNAIVPIFFETPDIFLQFLYQLNIICYEERHAHGVFIRWCFRERGLTNMSPRVKEGKTYTIHLGLTRALNVGRKLY